MFIGNYSWLMIPGSWLGEEDERLEMTIALLWQIDQ
jgi:hypothetical protein